MALSKRLRHEILRRDNFTCRYCGHSAPDVKLTVDHVTPVALGGSDDPGNLVAACVDCNAGKGSTSPTDDLVTQVGEDDIRWAAAVQRAATKLLDDVRRASVRHEWFLTEWRAWDDDLTYLPNGWDRSLDHWTGAGLPREVLVDCLDTALTNRGVTHHNVFAYMGGIARKRIEQLHETARALLDDDEGATDGA